MTEGNASRRDFVKRATYVTPAVLTLAAVPEFAKAGSVKAIDIGKDRKLGLGKDRDLGKALGKEGRPGKGQGVRRDKRVDARSQRASSHSSRVAKGVAQSHATSPCGSADGRVGSVDCAIRHLTGQGEFPAK